MCKLHVFPHLEGDSGEGGSGQWPITTLAARLQPVMLKVHPALAPPQRKLQAWVMDLDWSKWLLGSDLRAVARSATSHFSQGKRKQQKQQQQPQQKESVFQRRSSPKSTNELLIDSSFISNLPWLLSDKNVFIETGAINSKQPRTWHGVVHHRLLFTFFFPFCQKSLCESCFMFQELLSEWRCKLSTMCPSAWRTSVPVGLRSTVFCFVFKSMYSETSRCSSLCNLQQVQCCPWWDFKQRSQNASSFLFAPVSHKPHQAQLRSNSLFFAVVLLYIREKLPRCKLTFSLLHFIYFLPLFLQLFPNRILWITSTPSSSS